MALYYVKQQEPTENPHVYHEFCVNKSGTSNLFAARRRADKIVAEGGRAFVQEYGKGVIYTPKTKGLWESPSKSSGPMAASSSNGTAQLALQA